MSSQFSQDKFTKPKTLACYICGRQFGTKSLCLHLKPCKEKFKIQQDQKVDKTLKIKLPDPPQLLQLVLSQAEVGCLSEEILEKYNEQARNTHKYKVLPACKYCSRTFNEESLASHMKACPKKSSYSESKQKDHGYKIPDQIKKPRTLVCCVCGRQFGITSLKIHYPQCQEKFKNQELKKPPRQRNPVPSFSQEDLEMVNNKNDWGPQELNDFNQRASTNFRNKAMVQCENCKRKFLPESYKRHQKNCKLINGDKGGSKSLSKFGESTSSSAGYDLKQFKKPKVLMCHICGRQFGLTSLKIHLKNCAQKFMNEEQKRPKKQRRPLPEMNVDLEEFDIATAEKWSVQKIEEYNQAANQIYKGCALFPCPICGRKFFEDSLKRHLNYCQKNAEQKQMKEDITNQSKQKAEKSSPRNFQQNVSKVQSNKSLIKPSENLNAQKAEDLASTSKTLNIRPSQQAKQAVQPILTNTIKEVNQDLESTIKENPQELATQTFAPKIQNQMGQDSEEVSINRVECSKCNRKFAENRVQKHESICKGLPNKKSSQPQNQEIPKSSIQQNSKKPTKEKESHPARMDKSQFEEFQQENIPPSKDLSNELMECQKCGKKFMPSKIQKHTANCKDVAFKLKNKQTKQKNASPLTEENVQFAKKSQVPKLQKPTERIQKESSEKKIVDRIKQDLMASPQKEQNKDGLVNCKYCNRKFGSDRLEKHQNVCLNKKDHEEKQKISERQLLKSRQKSSNKLNFANQRDAGDRKESSIQQTQEEKIDLVPCQKCGRKFASGRVQKHENICKGPSLKNKKQQIKLGKLNHNNSHQNEENQFLSNQQKTPQNSKKKYMFNIKPVNKKTQKQKNQFPKDTSDKNTIKQNIKFTEDLINEIWDTKETPKGFTNNSESFSQNKLQSGLQKVNKTAYEGGFYKSKYQKEESEEKYSNSKFEEIQNVQRVQCQKCGRKFVDQRIQKHQQICNGSRQNPPSSKTNFPRYNPLNQQKNSRKLINQKQSVEISESVILPESRDIIKNFKEIKNMKINQSYIDKQLDKELEQIKSTKPLKQIKSIGFGARNTYGGGQKFYSKKQSSSTDKFAQAVSGQNSSMSYQSKYLQPIANQGQTPKNAANRSIFTVKKWNK